jgi:hypothetical protein
MLPSSVIAAATEQLLGSDSPLNQRKWNNRLTDQRKAIFIIESLGVHPKPTNTPPGELRQTFAIITMLDVSA